MYTFLILVILSVIIVQCFKKGEAKVSEIFGGVIIAGMLCAIINSAIFGFYRNSFDTRIRVETDTITLSNDSIIYDFLYDKYPIKDSIKCEVVETMDSISTVNKCNTEIDMNNHWIIVDLFPDLKSLYIIKLNKNLYELYCLNKTNDK